jgi:phosphonate dehydrogenase
MPAPRPRVVVSHWVHPEVVDYLAEFCDAVIPTRDEGVWPRAQLVGLAADADGLVMSMADSVDAAFLERCHRLRVVSATLKGYDNFDADACARRGVWLAIVPDTLIAPTAELTIGLIIGIMRRMSEGDRAIRSHSFDGWRPRLYGSTLQGATVGVVGMGQLGQAVARRLSAFEPRIVYHDSRPLPPESERALATTYLDLDQLVVLSDVLVVLLPLTDRTRHLIDASVLARLPAGACLVNVGRGSVVDEEAVADALEAGSLAGYAADVFSMEDWALPGRPAQIPERLLKQPRTLFTPHLGSAVDDVRRRMSLEAARQVRQALDGRRPDHAVNHPER